MKFGGLKIISILLKCVQIALVLAASGSVAYYFKELRNVLQKAGPAAEERDYNLGFYGRLEFFLYTTAVGAIIAFCELVAILRGLLEKNGGALAMVVSHSLWALQLLVSAALLTKVYASLHDRTGGLRSPCRDLKKLDRDFNCDQILIGVVCGFMAAGAFAADVLLSLVSYNRQSELHA